MGKKHISSTATKEQTSQSTYQKQKPNRIFFFSFLAIVGIVLAYSVLYQNNLVEIPQRGKQKIVLINTDRPVESQIIKDYFADKLDQYKVVHKYTQARHSSNYYLLWTHYYWDINFVAQKKGQIVSHMEKASDVYDNKNTMNQILEVYDKSTNYHIKSDDFIPLTYTWDIQDKKISAQEKELFSLKQDNNIWIIKNPIGQGGKGIKMINNIVAYAQQIKRAKQLQNNDPEFLRFKQAQLYIKNPLLINGRKAEYRAYALIANMDPELIIFNKGFIKTALRKYDVNSKDMKAHLTNLAEARKNEEEYNKIKNEAYLCVSGFEKLLKETYGKSEEEIQKFYNKLQAIVTYTLLAGKDYLPKTKGTFETFAFDILLDQDLNPYLLEINQPYAVEGAFLNGYKDVLPDFYNATLDLILQINEENNDINELLKQEQQLKLGKNMKVVYNQVTGYNFLNNYHYN